MALDHPPGKDVSVGVGVNVLVTVGSLVVGVHAGATLLVGADVAVAVAV